MILETLVCMSCLRVCAEYVKQREKLIGRHHVTYLDLQCCNICGSWNRIRSVSSSHRPERLLRWRTTCSKVGVVL